MAGIQRNFQPALKNLFLKIKKPCNVNIGKTNVSDVFKENTIGKK